MKDDDTVYISIDLRISDSQYKYDNKAEGSIQFECPVYMLDTVDAGSIMMSLHKAVVAKFKKEQKDELDKG